jgi:hypothetical protein
MLRVLRNPWFLLGLGLWQLVVVFTPVSLYGFWTDAVVFAAWLSWSGYLALTYQFRHRWLNSFGPALLGFVFALPIILPASLGGLFFVLELTGTRSVPQDDKLQGFLLVNQYFRPTGAPGCGMGSLTTAKAWVFFPLVEYRTDFDPCTHEDWGYLIEHGSWEGWDEGPAQ